MTGTLVLTNDFGPRIGGIEAFVGQLAATLPGRVVVLTARQDGQDAFDAALPYRVIRRDERTLLPTPLVAAEAARLLREEGLDRVLIGAAAPLGLLAPTLRRAGATRIVALSHGHEVWWASLPGSRSLLNRIVAGCDAVGVISDYTHHRIAAGLRQDLRERLVAIPPPVDTQRFTPAGDEPGPVVVSAGRFVPRKGFDTLVAAWRTAQPALPPDARLLIAGSGPDEARLRRLARGLPVTFTGPVAHLSMPDVLRRGRVFAGPVRTQRRGLNPEGFGLVFAEAAACGLPVLVGDSGGAPSTVVEGRTGWVLDPRDTDAWAVRLAELLGDPGRARGFGAAGRRHVLATVALDEVTRRVAAALELPGPLG